MQLIKLTQITSKSSNIATIFPLLLFSRQGQRALRTHLHSPAIRRSVSHDKACLGLATRGCTQTENKLSCEMKRNCGESAGSFSWVWFHQSYAPGWSPANSGDTEAGSVGDLSGSEAAGKRVLDPATRGSSAAAVIAEIFSIPALPESWQRLLQKIWLSLSRAVF